VGISQYVKNVVLATTKKSCPVCRNADGTFMVAKGLFRGSLEQFPASVLSDMGKQIMGFEVSTARSYLISAIRAQVNLDRSAQEDDVCMSCSKHWRDTVLLDCGLAPFCFPCSMKKLEGDRKCPVCNCSFSRPLQVYWT